MNDDYKPKQLSPTELLETFPDAIPVIRENLKACRQKLQTEAPALERLYYDSYYGLHSDKTLDEKTRNFWAYLFKELFFVGPLNKLRARIKEYERLLTIHRWQKNGGLQNGISGQDIARAKSHPLSNFIKIERSGFAFCPFHEERTPSFKVWKNNRWWCFGECQAGGDSIDFIMKLRNISFRDAVNMLM